MSNTDEKISNLLKFYFSDVNISRDNFLKTKLKEDNGWIKIETLLTFNRLKNLTDKVEKVLELAKQSKLFEIDETEAKIKKIGFTNVPDITLSDLIDKNTDRLYFLKGFSTDSSRDKIEDFLSFKNVNIELMIMINDQKKFTGSVAILVDKDSLEKFKEIETDLLYDTNKISTFQKAAWDGVFPREIKSSRKRKNTKKEKKKEQDIVRLNALIRIKNVPETTKAKSLKEAVKVHAEPEWVDRNEGDSIVRFKEPDAATKLLEKIKECDSVIEIDGNKYTPELITGQEETDYWKKVNDLLKNKKNKRRNNRN